MLHLVCVADDDGEEGGGDPALVRERERGRRGGGCR